MNLMPFGFKWDRKLYSSNYETYAEFDRLRNAYYESKKDADYDAVSEFLRASVFGGYAKITESVEEY